MGRVRCRPDVAEIRARCRRGEIVGGGRDPKRDPGESHRPRCPCGAAREGRARGQPTQTARAARVRVAGPARPLAHGKDLRAKRKGAGSASHQASPTLPATEAPALLLLWTTFATTGRRTSIQTLRLGSAPSASAATSSPHSAPQQCDPNDCGRGRAEEAMSVAQEGSRGERRAACLRRAHNVSELGELGEAAARHRGHGLDDVAHHAPGRPGPAVVLDSELDEPPDREGEGVPGG